MGASHCRIPINLPVERIGREQSTERHQDPSLAITISVRKELFFFRLILAIPISIDRNPPFRWAVPSPAQYGLYHQHSTGCIPLLWFYLITIGLTPLVGWFIHQFCRVLPFRWWNAIQSGVSRSRICGYQWCSQLICHWVGGIMASFLMFFGQKLDQKQLGWSSQ